MDKQQKLEYQGKIENFLGKEHVYDLFEELLKQLIIRQPDDPISFLIDRLSAPQSSPHLTQRRRSSSSDHRGSKYASSRFRWRTTTSLRRSRWATCSRKKSPKSRNWARKSSPTSSTSPSSRTRSSPRWSRRKFRASRRRRKASSCRAIRGPGCRDWPCSARASSPTPSSSSTCPTTRSCTSASNSHIIKGKVQDLREESRQGNRQQQGSPHREPRQGLPAQHTADQGHLSQQLLRDRLLGWKQGRHTRGHRQAAQVQDQG